MFTNLNTKFYSEDKILTESACLSTDTKPTQGIKNGSTCIEMDTGKTYMFDEANGEWLEVNSGGGGGGGGVNLHTATLTFVGSNDTATLSLFSYIDESTGCLDVNYEAPLIGSYVVPLYNAEGGGRVYNAEISPNGEQLSMSTSGDITISEEFDPETGDFSYYALTITGDCTITIN